MVSVLRFICRQRPISAKKALERGLIFFAYFAILFCLLLCIYFVTFKALKDSALFVFVDILSPVKKFFI